MKLARLLEEQDNYRNPHTCVRRVNETGRLICDVTHSITYKKVDADQPLIEVVDLGWVPGVPLQHPSAGDTGQPNECTAKQLQWWIQGTEGSICTQVLQKEHAIKLNIFQ